MRIKLSLTGKNSHESSSFSPRSEKRRNSGKENRHKRHTDEMVLSKLQGRITGYNFEGTRVLGAC